ncbi:MAG TPA: GTPase HflX, partial [Leptospiraceae bacterium]|nr:GTPase HflX [Leptospiraceae bacterium]
MLQKQKALIIGVNLNGQPDFHESMDELHNLAIACEFTVVGRAEQNLKTANSAYYIGYGKIEEIRLLTEETEANIIIFNNELSPSQVKNLEKELDLEILDRTSLILEIFAKRAKTREAK